MAPSSLFFSPHLSCVMSRQPARSLEARLHRWKPVYTAARPAAALAPRPVLLSRTWSRRRLPWVQETVRCPVPSTPQAPHTHRTPPRHTPQHASERQRGTRARNAPASKS